MDLLTRIPLLTEPECQTVRETVFALKDFWLQRNPFLPFYTLGSASYLDAAHNPQDYYQKAQRYNPLLLDRLSWLYEKLAASMAQTLQAPVSYQHPFALPGFHVYLFCILFEKPIASIHCDSQYQLLDWEDTASTDFTNPISFTLTISLPKFGGGLNLWDIHYQDMLELPSAEFQQLLHSRSKTFYPYQLGQLVVHSGYTLHQAAPAQNIQPDDERITLQGHSLFSQGKWQLYW